MWEVTVLFAGCVVRAAWGVSSGVLCLQIRDSIVVSVSACHAEDPGSIPGRGVFQRAISEKASHVGSDLV